MTLVLIILASWGLQQDKRSKADSEERSPPRKGREAGQGCFGPKLPRVPHPDCFLRTKAILSIMSGMSLSKDFRKWYLEGRPGEIGLWQRKTRVRNNR